MVRQIIFLGLALLFSLPLYAGKIDVYSDRPVVAVDESFTLTFESSEKIQGEPDFTPLERHFSILSTSQSNSTSIINGKIDQKHAWVLTLMPTAVGKVVVPPINFGSDRTTPLTIEVKDQVAIATPSQEKDETIFIEVELDRTQAYVQQQVIYTFRLFRAINISGGSVTPPKLTADVALFEQIGDDREYEKRVDGRRYLVLERRYALFAQQPGVLTIAPLQFEAQIPDGSQYGLLLFNQTTKVKRLRSQPLSLDVLPRPANYRGTRWLPASSLTLEERWPSATGGDKPILHVGEPVTRVITMQAEGLLAAQLPELVIAYPDGVKSYPDQPRLTDHTGEKGFLGERIEKMAIIPTQAGRLLLPSLQITWWDVANGQERVTTLPAQEFMVVAGSPAAAAAPTTPTDQQAGGSRLPPFAGNSGENVSLSRADGLLADHPGWQWLALLLAFGWLLHISYLLWLRRQKKQQRQPLNLRQQRKNQRHLAKAVKEACSQNSARSCQQALLAWGAAQWPELPPLSLGDMAAGVHPELANELEILNRALYSAAGTPWQNGQQLWRAMRLITEEQPESATVVSPLAPLYPTA
ncbi:MAG: protein BatD [Gammaproteobacteria bacterium]|nr:protein BatD [Gammaproteobacteria bacterium]